jgi:hypothetical protein
MVPSPPYSSVYLLGDFTMYLQYRSMRSFCRNRGTDYFSVVTVTVVIHGFEREVQPELRDAQNRDERLHVSITHLPFSPNALGFVYVDYDYKLYISGSGIAHPRR